MRTHLWHSQAWKRQRRLWPLRWAVTPWLRQRAHVGERLTALLGMSTVPWGALASSPVAESEGQWWTAGISSVSMDLQAASPCVGLSGQPIARRVESHASFPSPCGFFPRQFFPFCGRWPMGRRVLLPGRRWRCLPGTTAHPAPRRRQGLVCACAVSIRPAKCRGASCTPGLYLARWLVFAVGHLCFL